MRTMASFLRYSGYINFINGPISRVLLLILVNVQVLAFQKAGSHLALSLYVFLSTACFHFDLIELVHIDLF